MHSPSVAAGNAHINERRSACSLAFNLNGWIVSGDSGSATRQRVAPIMIDHDIDGFFGNVEKREQCVAWSVTRDDDLAAPP